MITIKLNIKSSSDLDYISSKENNYSYAFRNLYSNFHLIGDLLFINYLKVKFNLNEIEYRSLASEVKSKLSQINSFKEKSEEDIINLTKELSKLKSLPHSNLNNRKIIKLEKKLSYKSKQLSKDIVFGRLTNLRKLSFLNNDKENNKEKIIEVKSLYSEGRKLPFSLLGEANQKGNRFFSFDLTNNKVTYKPNKDTKIYFELSQYKSYKLTLLKLQELINLNNIAISVRLSSKFIYLTFDEEILGGYNLDISQRTKEVKLINEKNIDKDYKSEIIKEIYSRYYDKQRNLRLNNKLYNRYLAFDTNPDSIGISIVDKVGDDIKIIYTVNYDLSKNNIKLPKNATQEERTKLNNKRKTAICHLWKDVFRLFSYYNCGYLVMEDLNFKSNNKLSTTEGNRKSKNLWYRELSSNLINKYCNLLGINKIEGITLL